MNPVIFYSILLFILICFFMPSIYNYAYSSFIGRIVIILLIIVLSKQNIFLGLIFITIVITYSYPLYEGFTAVANGSLVTSNYSVNDKNDNNQVFNYFTNFYCSKDGSGNLSPNQTKLNRWSGIVSNNANNSSQDEIALANYNIDMATNKICVNNQNLYNDNYYNFLNNEVNSAMAGYSGLNYITQYSDDYNVFASLNNNDPCSYQNSNYVYNTPKCLSENLSNTVCNAIQTGGSISNSATTVSTNYNLSPESQQDGQWVVNTQTNLCQ